MGRMYGKGKGMSGSSIPYRRAAPTWVKKSTADVVASIVKLARKGLSPSEIGATLRDKAGVPLVKGVVGTSIQRILRGQGLAPQYPEDLLCLIKKALSVRKHMATNTKDGDAKYRLILVESKIHRLARYYKRTKRLPATFKYSAANASAIVA